MNEKKFLIVDDEELMRHVLATILEIKGVKSSRIAEAIDGQDAWEKFSVDPASFQVIITDINMPRMDGRELIQKILHVVKGIKIICMSGFPTGEIEGAVFIQKPFRIELLEKEIENYV